MGWVRAGMYFMQGVIVGGGKLFLQVRVKNAGNSAAAIGWKHDLLVCQETPVPPLQIIAPSHLLNA